MVRNILLIDDDADELNIFVEALDAAGIRSRCTWAESALHVPEIKPVPEIIFLDLNMPRVDGFDCLKEIKASPAFVSIPVVLYSTGMNDELKEKGMLMGASACIAKTYSIAELAETLTLLLDAGVTA